MFKVSITSTLHKDRPKNYCVYSKDEIKGIWVRNARLVNIAKSDGVRNIICFVVENELLAMILTACLIREALDEDTTCITYLPSSRVLYVYFEHKINWIENVKGKIVESARRILKESGIPNLRIKDKWGEVLFDLSNRESVLMGRME